MRKFLMSTAFLGAAVFTVVGLANSGSGSLSRAQVPTEARTHDAKASAKGSRFALLYHFHDVKVAPGETDGRAIRCRKGWHPISGWFTSESDGVLAARNAPVSTRKWEVLVFNQGATEATVTVGIVCEKGLNIPPPPG
jgi:hypothetical protein